MANDSPKAVPSALPPESYPPFPTDPANLDANGAPPPPGIPYMFPYPPPSGMLWAFPPAPQSQSPSAPSSASRPKRRQVKMACTNCAQACKRCDDQRPCLRCQKYGMTDSAGPGTATSLPASESFAAEVGAGPPAAEWTASHGPPPAPAAAPPFCTRATRAARSAAVPQPFPAPPKGYPHPFYPPMGFFLGPPPPGAEDGAAPMPYFYPYPPFGMYPPLRKRRSGSGGAEDEWGECRRTNEVNGNGASADAGEGGREQSSAAERIDAQRALDAQFWYFADEKEDDLCGDMSLTPEESWNQLRRAQDRNIGLSCSTPAARKERRDLDVVRDRGVSQHEVNPGPSRRRELDAPRQPVAPVPFSLAPGV
ncbi:hypothetical protein B0H14DRAFT_3519709 [Mycena olivaceomarginata]|nr:hypothetical protein B0H14DRAFT_3519709 [Mycena olivaceomarginata]